MALTLVTAPTELPVSLAELEQQVQSTSDRNRPTLRRLLAVATSRAERELRRALITQTWRVQGDSWPASRVWTLPKPPLQEVGTVGYYDANNASQIIVPGAYYVDAPAGPNPQAGSVRFAADLDWPDLFDRPNATWIEFTAGYGDRATDVPEDIRHGILMLAAHLFEFRMPYSANEAIAAIPMTIDYLWSPYRALCFA